ncbi:MAG: ABC transporter permease [Prolixibacteraceae bacterium]|nr:ABC transporter permease [Prolixibacteraceae bacterium]
MKKKDTVNTGLFIARRLFSKKENKGRLSHQIVNIAVLGISLGVMVMLIAFAIVTGFKKEISGKVFGFGGHIQIVNYDSNNSYETAPVSREQKFLKDFDKIENIRRVNVFATKPGLIKTNEYTQGIVLKGVAPDYSWDFFEMSLVAGKLPNVDTSERSNDLLISSGLSAALKLKTDDQVYMYFINEDDLVPRIRQFRISGIYSTNFQEFDKMIAVTDLRQIQHINNWDENQISGFEILLHNFGELDKTNGEILRAVVNYNSNDSALRTITITRKFPQIFDWLSTTDMNVWVILVLMALVAGFNMISALLVIILERISLVGILKSLGMSNRTLRWIFLYLSGLLIFKGLLWGNIAGLLLLGIQKYFHIIKLDPSSYYMDVVPVNLTVWGVLLLNAAAIAITMLMMMVPAHFVSKISPVKSIQFD